MINNTSLSFEATKANLKAHVKSKPDSQGWIDFIDSGVGTTFIELLAGVSTYQAFQKLVERRERYLETAQFDTSINELAFNRGFLMSPVLAATLTVTIIPTNDFSVVKGDLVGGYSDQSLISYENKSFLVGVQSTLLCIVGVINTTTQNVSGVQSFQKFEYTYPESFIASQLEELTIDDAVVPLESELNYLADYSGNFILRRVVNNMVKVYAGNGIIGYCNKDASTVTYRCITYNTIVTNGNVSIYKPATLISFAFTTQASYYLSKEELRGIATYYPLDGRISQDRDYEAVILKYFGGVVLDVYAHNTDPNEQIRLLVPYTLRYSKLQEIRRLVDMKRAQGILTYYHIDPLPNGTLVQMSFKLSSQYYVNDNISLIRKYIESKYLNKYFRSNTKVSLFDLAIDITQKYGFPLYPVSDQVIEFTAGQYINNVDINVISI